MLSHLKIFLQMLSEDNEALDFNVAMYQVALREYEEQVRQGQRPGYAFLQYHLANIGRSYLQASGIESEPSVYPTQGTYPDTCCPRSLRLQVIEVMEHYCQYCQRKGTAEIGPDGKPWHIDRIVPGRIGGLYIPSNVTLSCGKCNISKKDKIQPGPTASLASYQMGSAA
jgi:hypothetical protein